MKKILIISLSLFQLSLFAKSISFASPEKQVNLLELYTSESCSSCPPAEKRLNSYRKSDKLWKEIVPVEFHVDYWNYLHWIDRFSSSEFSSRQRNYHSVIKAGVYTPQMILSGKDWRSWRHSKVKKSLFTPGVLKADLDTKSLQSKISFTIKKEFKNKNFKCFAALMGGGFTTVVERGENKDKTLSHEFVVLDLQESQLEGSQCKLSFNQSKKNELKPKRVSVAYWIMDPITYNVIQATGGEI